MAPTIVASKVKDLINFANKNNEVVIKPLGGKGGQGVIRINKNSPGIKSIIELITSQEQLPVMMQKFIPEVIECDKRIIMVNGEAIGSITNRNFIRSSLIMLLIYFHFLMHRDHRNLRYLHYR